MNKLILIISICLTLPNLAFGQENYQIDLLSKHKVNAIEFYNFKIVDGNVLPDSIMNMKATFNSKGYIVNTIIYDSLAIKARYEKVYQHDTILVEMNTYNGTDEYLFSTAKFEYKNGNRVTETHFTNEEKVIELINFYNKDNLLSKSITRFKGQKTYKEIYKYNANTQLVKRKGKNSTWQKRYYDKYGRHLSTYQIKRNKSERKELSIEYAGNTNQKTSLINKYYRSYVIIGEGGVLDIKNGDVVRKEFHYLENGLIDYVEQYLNGTLNAVKKYKYIQ